MIIQGANLVFPDTGERGHPKRTVIGKKGIADKVIALFSEYEEDIEQYFDCEFMQFTAPAIHWQPQGCIEEAVKCDNSLLKGGRWSRSNAYDFTCIIFLKDYNDKPDFDPLFECYGGQISFPTHDVILKPQRGTLLVYPSGPNFINSIKPPVAGDNVFLRFNAICEKPYVYDIKKFPRPGNGWFKR